MQFRVLRAHAREVTLRVVGRAVLRLPARVPRLGRLRLHGPASLLVLVYLRLVLLHVLVVVLGHATALPVLVGRGAPLLLAVL